MTKKRADSIPLEIELRQGFAADKIKRERDSALAVQELRGSDPLGEELRAAIADLLEGKVKLLRGRPPKRIARSFTAGQTSRDPAWWADVRHEIERRKAAGEKGPEIIEDLAKEYRIKDKTILNKIYSPAVVKAFRAKYPTTR